MNTIFRDVLYGLRILAKNPGFAAIAIVTLGLGIGVNSAIFSLVNAVLLRPLPYPDPEQLIGLGQWRSQKGEGYIQTGVSAPNIVDIEKTGIFQQVAYYRFSGFNITEGTRPESVRSIRASSELLPMFGVQPEIGRGLLPEEMRDGHDQVAVIGHRLWQVRYGSDPQILGKQINLDRRPYTIVGVMPASFRFTWDQEMDIFVPLVLTPEEQSEMGRGTSRDLQTQARLKPNISISQAQVVLDSLAQVLAREYPAANAGWGFKVEPLHAAYHRHMQVPLMIMLGAVLFVLLIACANVANLLLARATGRKREMAIRASIGATRRRLVSQLLTESLTLAVLGGALGLLLAFAGDRLLTFAMNSYGFALPNAKVIDLDWRVLLFSLAVTVSTGVVFGLAPTLATSKLDLGEALKEGGLSTTAEPARRRLRNALVVSEMALALVLLTGAGLLIRTFVRLVNVDLGINPNNVVTMGLRLPDYKYDSPQKQAIFFRQFVQNIQGVPGVVSAGIEGGGANVFFQPQGAPAALPGQEPTAAFKSITSDFLRAMGTGLVAGRTFSDHDTSESAPVALISETVAHRYWPDSNPIGSHLTVLSRVYSGQAVGASQPLQIVGVVKDVRNEDLWIPEAAIYIPFDQRPSAGVFAVIRTSVPPLSVVPQIRKAVSGLDSEQPLNEVRTMDDIMAQTYGSLRFPMTLLWIFAGLALILAAVGIFGVMSYTVSRRTQEMAIRMALGASRHEVLMLVLREGLRVTAFGIALGLAAALALSRVMTGYVYGVSVNDPLTMIAASLLLIGAALLASYLPARRATSVNPMSALRYE